MCLTCGCNQAHKVMGKNLTYENIRDIAAQNGKTVDETLAMLTATAQRDRAQHVDEYARPARDRQPGS